MTAAKAGLQININFPTSPGALQTSPDNPSYNKPSGMAAPGTELEEEKPQDANASGTTQEASTPNTVKPGKMPPSDVTPDNPGYNKPGKMPTPTTNLVDNKP